MELKAKTIKTPIGYIHSPLNPYFKKELEKCKTNEDLFALVEQKGFINPDAFNEVVVRFLYSDYCKWKENKK